MRPDETEALEAAAWRAFVARLADHLAGQWPALPERLGERYPAFVDLAVQQAGERGLRQAPSVARFVNLWFVWGPAYHDKPGFEWAQDILRGAPLREWLAVHQLVQRSMAELQRLPGSRIEPAALASADTRLLDAFGALGRRGRLRSAEPALLPRAACDADAADIRLIDDAWHQQYRLGSADASADWQRVALALPPPLRVDAQHPMPKLLAVLSHVAEPGPQARLQVRLRPHAVCHGDVHPVLGFSGPHGRWVWTGHEAKAASWPVAARDQPLPGPGPGCLVAEESSPELQRLEIETCGLRDQGDAVGSLQATVSVWPAAQWWIEIQRALPPAQAVLPGPRPWQRGSTRCRVECDGGGRDASALKQQFEDGLDGALAVGVQSLAAAWERLPGLSAPRLDAQLGLLVGQAGITWGWHFGPGGLDGPAVMRVLGQIALDACQAELALGGELALHGTRTRIGLQVAGQAALRQRVQRELPLPPLADVLLGVAARWRFPVTLSLEPLATESGSLLQQAGPASGALVGEAGLRPCTQGSSGWAWFVGLRLEAVVLPLQLIDPVLGSQRLLLPLLPALVLVDWGLG